jgi:hypothetical protein
MKLHVSCSRLAAGFAVGLFGLVLGVKPVTADVFSIDTNQTSFTISGSIQGSSFVQQGAGSLTTHYGGTVQLNQTAGTIQFTGLSLIAAQTNGSWQPQPGGVAGNAPANYGASASIAGGLVTVLAALRSIVFDVTSPSITLSNGQFDPSSLTFLLPTNGSSALAYKESGFATGSGTKLLTGYATNNVAILATLSTAGTQQTLSVGVNTQFQFSIVSANDTILNVVGQLVATRGTTAPLVIQPPTVVNHTVMLNWQAAAGQFYKVQSTSNLQTWQTTASNVTAASTNYTWTATNNAPQGFYRLAQ